MCTRYPLVATLASHASRVSSCRENVAHDVPPADKTIVKNNGQVINAAKPSTNIQVFMSNHLRATLPEDSDVDLIIVDYGVNDANLETFGGGINDLKLQHEALISYVRNDMIHMPAILYAESFITPARVRQEPSQGTNMAEVHADVTRKHDVPMVSGKGGLAFAWAMVQSWAYQVCLCL